MLTDLNNTISLGDADKLIYNEDISLDFSTNVDLESDIFDASAHLNCKYLNL